MRLGLLKIVPDVRFLGSGLVSWLPGFVSVAIPKCPAESLLHLLDLKGVAVSAGAACDSKNTQISHVLKAIGLPARYAPCTVRISLGIENTSEDVDAILAAVRFAVKRIRSA